MRGWGPVAALAALLLVGAFGSRASAQEFFPVSTVGFGEELTAIGISHRDPNFVMIGTSMGKLLRSVDNGQTWQEIIVTPMRTLFYGRERSPDPRMEYALGLPGKSPHLQRWLRQQGLHTSGINLQQLLVQKGEKSVNVNWIEVDWHDENRVWVGTVDGLYLSVDKARSFQRVWQGKAGQAERMVTSVVTDPSNPRRLLVGTAQGLFISEDRGLSLEKDMNYYIHDSYIRALYFDRQQAGLVHMAMGGSAMASPDGGKHWITTHWDTWGPRADAQWISLGPNNVRLMGTRDGFFASWQGGEMGTWKRRGPRFVGQVVTSVQATSTANYWYCTTDDAVWMTDDAGTEWRKVMHLGAKEMARRILAWDNDPTQLWVLTNRRIYRLRTLTQMRQRLAASRVDHLRGMPSLQDLWKKVAKHKKLDFADIQRYRNRAPWAAMLPEFYLGARYTNGIDTVSIRAFPHLHWPWSHFYRLGERGLVIEAFAMWDLTRFIFDRRQMPHFGRVDRTLTWLRDELSERVARLYVEYKQLVKAEAFDPPRSELAREFRRIRLQEIAAFLDAVSGGYWSQVTGGVL
ncbi:MAG: hypothetical protein IT371_20345 [Deltaproteobacteria bacterium]|nr:hypothetical protein [Deltaproteobacteria bacterium]